MAIAPALPAASRASWSWLGTQGPSPEEIANRESPDLPATALPQPAVRLRVVEEGPDALAALADDVLAEVHQPAARPVTHCHAEEPALRREPRRLGRVTQSSQHSPSLDRQSPAATAPGAAHVTPRGTHHRARYPYPMAASLDSLPFRHVLPHSAALSPAGRLSIGGCDVRDLATEFGSPLYVFDEADFRATCQEFRREFEQRWPNLRVAYAGKAFLSRGIARILAEEGIGMDVVSGGELAVARAAGFPAENLYFHGNNKLPSELAAALDNGGIGRVVVDNFYELETLEQLAGERGVTQPILLRISPNVDPHTHAKTTTGVLDSKFGFAVATGDAERAVKQAMEAKHLDLRGLHVHLGSPIFETEPYEQGNAVVAAFASQMGDIHGFEFKEYSPGGGFALAYTREQHPPSIAEYAETVTASLRRALEQHHLPEPVMHIEPGRALVGRSMVALYTVGARKEIPGVRTYVSLDGGMADNIRPAIYGSKYEAFAAERPLAEPEETVTLAGKYCESGDILVSDAEVPRFTPGELVALPASGAYNLAMSSNYNLAQRPPVVAVQDGEARLFVRRETVDDLLARDMG